MIIKKFAIHRILQKFNVLFAVPTPRNVQSLIKFIEEERRNSCSHFKIFFALTSRSFQKSSGAHEQRNSRGKVPKEPP